MGDGRDDDDGDDDPSQTVQRYVDHRSMLAHSPALRIPHLKAYPHAVQNLDLLLGWEYAQSPLSDCRDRLDHPNEDTLLQEYPNACP